MKLHKLSIENLWVLAVLGSCFGYVCTLPVEQYDFWHYIKTGEWMLREHRLFDRDVFSFAIEGKRFVNYHWGSQLLFYWTHLLGGIPLMVFVHACSITGAYGLVFAVANRRARNLRIAAGVTFIAFLLGATNFALRPQGYSIFLVALTLYLLEAQSRRMPYLLPITMAVWANVHGAFLVGLLLTGIKWMGALGRPRAAAEQYRVSDSATILAALILSGLATLATPWGPRLYPALLHVEAASRSSLVTEWEPTTLQEPTGVLFFAALLGLVVLCQRARTTWNREQLLTFLMFTLLAVREQRAVIWWGMAAAPLFAEALREVYRDRPRRAAAASRDLPGVNLCIAAVFILYLIGCLPWWKGGNPLLPEIKKPLLESATPVRLGEELARLPRAHRIFGNVSWGSYFIWRMRDDQKIFYDPRVHMYPETIMGDYFLITNGFGQWEELLDHHRIDTLVVSPEEQRLLIPLVRKSGKWKEVYKDADRQGMIFLRQRKEENTQ